MDKFTQKELEEALRAITSTIHKSGKAQLKLKAGTVQHKMIARGIEACKIATGLIKKESEANGTEGSLEGKYTKDELEAALQALASAIGRIESVLPKFNAGTSQYTLAIRRIKAFRIAMELMKRELDS